jgi:hypothetical protein
MDDVGDGEPGSEGNGSPEYDGCVVGGTERVGPGDGVAVVLGVGVGVGVAIAPRFAGGGKFTTGLPCSAPSMNDFHNRAGIDPPVTSDRPSTPWSGLLLSRNSATDAESCGV